MYRIKQIKTSQDFAVIVYAGTEPAEYDKVQIERELKIKNKKIQRVYFRPREK